MVSAYQMTLVVGAGPSRTGCSSGFAALASSTVDHGRSKQLLMRYLLVSVHDGGHVSVGRSGPACGHSAVETRLISTSAFS